MSTHTAGPWVFVEWYPNEYRVTNDGERDRIALIDSNLPDEECRANARLIASAPELLAALQELEQALRWHFVPMVNDYAKAPAAAHAKDAEIERARAAIAKATGEQSGEQS